MAKQISGVTLAPSTTLAPDITLAPQGSNTFYNTQILYLFEFEIKSLDGLTTETLRFTDNDLFIKIDNETYTPISISFDEIKEDFTLQADQVTILVDNIDGELTSEALTKEWRNNNGRIYRVIYNELPQEDIGLTPANLLYPSNTLFPSDGGIPNYPSDTLYPSDNLRPTYERLQYYINGIFSFDNGYPSIDFDKVEYSNNPQKDLIFEGLIDDFKGGSGSVTFELTSVLSVWNTPFPSETFDQGQFKNIISAMTTSLNWGA